MNYYLVLGSNSRLGIDMQKFIYVYERKNTFKNWFLDDTKFLENNKFNFYSKSWTDITNYKSLKRTLCNFYIHSKGIKPKAIINFIGFTDVDRFETDSEYCNNGMMVNGYSLVNLIAICNELDIPLIHISTDYVLNEENYANMPMNKYGESKLIGENLIREYCRKYKIFRISGLYSIFKSCSINKFINEVLYSIHTNDIGREYYVCSDWYFTPTSTFEVYYGLIKCLEELNNNKYESLSMNNGIWDLCSSSYVSKFDFNNIILRELYESGILTLSELPEIIPVTKESLNFPAYRPNVGLCNSYFMKRFKAFELKDSEKFLKFMVQNIVANVVKNYKW